MHLCDFAAPYPSSFVPTLEAVRERAQARRWRFEAVFASGAEDRDWYRAAQEGGMRVRTSPRLSRRGRARWVDALVAEHNGPTVLHTHFARWDVPAVLAARSRRRPNPVAVIWHRHGQLSRSPRPLARDLVRYGVAARLVDAHLCVGPGGHAQVIRRGSPRRRTLLFPNGIDMARFSVAARQDRLRARAELGIGPEIDVLVSFMWEWERKGGPLLLDAVRELTSRGRVVLALTVGAGDRGRLEAHRVGVESHIREVAQRIDPSVFFNAADAFVAPSRAEGLAVAPLEAICCGTPVVASDIPGHRHLGVHLPAMRLTPLDAGALTDAIEAELAADPADRAARVAASRDYLEAHAGLDAWVQRLLHVYEQALVRRGVIGVAATAA